MVGKGNVLPLDSFLIPLERKEQSDSRTLHLSCPLSRTPVVEILEKPRSCVWLSFPFHGTLSDIHLTLDPFPVSSLPETHFKRVGHTPLVSCKV